jgi:hypothetical protein
VEFVFMSALVPLHPQFYGIFLSFAGIIAHIYPSQNQ